MAVQTEGVAQVVHAELDALRNGLLGYFGSGIAMACSSPDFWATL
jgi:hypothetical protein